ncbi:hypothetical protein MLD38_005582 [Melastoma candidum]|uniref:Uncharacterized protein n=1 Tax=Melastoma candidum TaxID=119954 RepID=A0ACB9RLE1_9MYRT|nr:hypothetical protein MLD38_005582 [Melastoma candidum]
MASLVVRDHQASYRGVRQHRWGVWIAEIDHPELNMRVWLGTFDSAEKAARAYDEAATMVYGPRSQTNFPIDPNANGLLANDIRANLQRIAFDAATVANKASPSLSTVEELYGMKVLKEEDVDEMIKELMKDDVKIEFRL